jgi:hypothetical protein
MPLICDTPGNTPESGQPGSVHMKKNLRIGNASLEYKNLFLLMLFIACMVWFGHRGNSEQYWGNPNELSRIYSAVSLVETGNFDFGPVVDEAGTIQ